jgi:hypothetical protein
MIQNIVINQLIKCVLIEQWVQRAELLSVVPLRVLAEQGLE